MRDFFVVRSSGAKSKQHDSHALWWDDQEHTCCGHPLFKGARVVNEPMPTCDGCVAAIRRERKTETQDALAPGNTLNYTQSALYPPVVEEVVIPTAYQPISIALNDTQSPLAERWRAALNQAWQLSPEPVATVDAYRNALERIDCVLALPEGYQISVPPTDFRALAPMVTPLQDILRAVGMPRPHIWLVAQTTASQPCDTEVSEEPNMAEPQVTPMQPPTQDLTLTPANKKAIWSLVLSERHRIVKETGGDLSTAHRQALEAVAAITTPPTDAHTLESFCSPTLKPVVIVPAETERNATPDTTLAQTRAWCAANDYLPKAGVLVHFTGKTETSFNSARRVMEHEGWQFSDMRTHWAVARPLSPDEIELERLLAEDRERKARIAELRAKLRPA